MEVFCNIDQDFYRAIGASPFKIAEVRELVETGAIAPEAVRTPGIFVDYMVAPAK